jgi:hypothetical protein
MKLTHLSDLYWLFFIYSGVKINTDINFSHFYIILFNPLLSLILKSLLNINKPCLYFIYNIFFLLINYI